MKIDLQKVLLWFMGSVCTAILTGAIGFAGWIWSHSHEISEIKKAFDRRVEIIDAADDIREFNVQERLSDLEAYQDTVKGQIRIIFRGKYPHDSLTILTRSGEWRTFEADLKRMYRRQ